MQLVFKCFDINRKKYNEICTRLIYFTCLRNFNQFVLAIQKEITQYRRSMESYRPSAPVSESTL